MQRAVLKIEVESLALGKLREELKVCLVVLDHAVPDVITRNHADIDPQVGCQLARDVLER